MPKSRVGVDSDQALELAMKLAEAWLEQQNVPVEVEPPQSANTNRVTLPGGRRTNRPISPEVVKKLAGVS